MEQKEQSQKAKVVLEVDGERKEFVSGTMLLVVNDGKGTFVRAIAREGGEKFFELYRSTKELVEEWEKEEPKLLEIYERFKGIERLFEKMKNWGIPLDEEGEADE